MTAPPPKLTVVTLGVRDVAASACFYEALGLKRKVSATGDEIAFFVGAGLLRRPEKTEYGGYRGYFSDPDGHAWEIVQAPGFAFTDDGRLILPD